MFGDPVAMKKETEKKKKKEKRGGAESRQSQANNMRVLANGTSVSLARRFQIKGQC